MNSSDQKIPINSLTTLRTVVAVAIEYTIYRESLTYVTERPAYKVVFKIYSVQRLSRPPFHTTRKMTKLCHLNELRRKKWRKVHQSSRTSISLFSSSFS